MWRAPSPAAPARMSTLALLTQHPTSNRRRYPYSVVSGSGLEVSRLRRRAKPADIRDRLRGGGFFSAASVVSEGLPGTALPALEDASLPESPETSAAASELELSGAAASSGDFVSSGAESLGADSTGTASEAAGASESAPASIAESPSTASESVTSGSLFADLADALREADFRGRRVRERLFGVGRSADSSS